jgi:maltose-binding protein MalE
MARSSAEQSKEEVHGIHGSCGAGRHARRGGRRHCRRDGGDERRQREIRIWVDQDRLPAITKVANDWAASKGVTLDIVQKGSDNIRADVKTVQPDTAPDLIVGAHDWVGELSRTAPSSR